MEKDRWEDVNRQVYAFLRQRLKDEAKVWFQTQENSAGLPAWKAIVGRYDPMTGATKLELHKRIHKMRRVKTLRAAVTAIEEWESTHRIYKLRTGQTLSDETCMNIILEAVPEAEEVKLRQNMRGRERETTYATLRQ